MRKILFILPLFCLPFSSCLLSLHHRQKPALVKGANIDETLKVAKDEMKKTNISKSLGLWVMRDQKITAPQAKEISKLYLDNIDSMKVAFNIWHSSWAIANMYKFGNDSVKAELATAYQKAKKQPERLTGNIKRLTNYHVNGRRTTTGFIHSGGRSYAHRHLVVPGNKKYIQSYEDYLKTQQHSK